MMKITPRILVFFTICFSAFCLSIESNAGNSDTGNDSIVTGPCGLIFPQDHGAHTDYRTEWWYYTGNVHSESSSRYGYQLTFFRSRITSLQPREVWPSPHSAWRTHHVYLGHAAISDLTNQQHLRSELTSRQALDMAGVFQASDMTRIHIRNWQAEIGSPDHRLTAKTDAFSFDLSLTPLKEPVLHGNQGYSRKGSAPEHASCYYSFTRLDTRGTLFINGEKVSVEGFSWMDHEYSTAPLDPGIVGWDWFSIQLDDHTELMLYVMRLDDGKTHAASSGTFVGPQGNSRHLERHEFRVDVLETWRSPHTSAVYPSRWMVTVNPLSMTLWISSSLDDQEMHSPQSTNVVYWEGSVSIEGKTALRSVKGSGYVEMTGYAKPFDVPM